MVLLMGVSVLYCLGCYVCMQRRKLKVDLVEIRTSFEGAFDLIYSKSTTGDFSFLRGLYCGGYAARCLHAFVVMSLPETSRRLHGDFVIWKFW